MQKWKFAKKAVSMIMTALIIFSSAAAFKLTPVHAEKQDTDINYTGTVISTSSSGSSAGPAIGGTADNPHVLANGTAVYLYSQYTVKYLKLIRDMEAAGTDTQSYQIPLSEYINVASITEQNLKVTVSGADYTIGSLKYDSAIPGLIITFNKGISNTTTNEGLYALVRDCLGENTDTIVSDKADYPSDSESTSYTGELFFSGTVNVTAEKYNQALEIKNMGSSNGYIRVDDPDNPVNPDFRKTGALDSDGHLIWTITLQRKKNTEGKYLSPDHYLLSDTLPALTELDSVSSVTDNGASVSSDVSRGTDTEYTLQANSAYYNTSAGDLAIDVTFGENETRRVYTIVTDVSGTADNNLIGKNVSNTATLKAQSPSDLPSVSDTGNISIPAAMTGGNISKNGVVTEDGKINWTVTVTGVNTAWMKYLTIYDQMSEDWKIDGGLTVSGNSGSISNFAGETIASPGSTSYTDNNGNSVSSGFKLELFNDTSGTKSSGYTISYTTTPASDDYWKNHDENDADTSNHVWLAYEWKAGIGPGTVSLDGPDITEFPVGSTAVDKSCNGYDRATGLFTWTVAVNPHEIPMQNDIILTDTMGTGMKLDPASISQDPSGTGYTLTDDEKKAVFGADNAAKLGDVIYKYDDTNGYSFTAKIPSTYVNSNKMTLTYKTKATAPALYAGNTSATDYTNKVSLSYNAGGTVKTAKDSATGKLISQVIEKTCLGYDYDTTATSAKTLKWKVVINQNKMCLSSVDWDTYVTDKIDETQDLAIGTGTPVTVIIGSTATDTFDTALSESDRDNNKNSFAYVKDNKLIVELKKDAVNGNQVTITFYTKLKDIDGFFKDASGNSLSNNIAYNGKTSNGTMDGYGAILHSPAGEVEDDASWNIRNALIEKNFIAADSADPAPWYSVGINPLGTTLPDDFTIVDTMDTGLSIVPDSFAVYETTAENSTSVSSNQDYGKVKDKTSGTDLKSNGTLTIGTEEGTGKSVFSYSFNFNNNRWGSDANKKTYVIRYQVLFSSGTSATYNNNVRISSSGYESQQTNAHRVYAYNAARINGLASSYGTIRVTKQTSETGHQAFAGATFTLTDSYGQVRTAVTAANGIATFALLPGGSSYTIRETKAPAGFADTGLPKVIAENVTINVANNVTRSFTYDPSADSLSGTLTPLIGSVTAAQTYSFAVRNKPALFTVNFMKKDQYGRTVQGAEFKVYDETDAACSTVLAEGTSDANGVVSLNMSSRGAGNYKCKETKAPAGITFDAAGAPEYFFKIDVHGNIDGLYENAGYTGDVIKTIINNSSIPPATTASGTGKPNHQATAGDNSEQSAAQNTAALHSSKALGARMSAKAPDGTEKLPKTGGFVGSMLLFMAGACMARTGIYLSRSSKKRYRNEKDSRYWQTLRK